MCELAVTVVVREKNQRQEWYPEFKVLLIGLRFSEWETRKDEERQEDVTKSLEAENDSGISILGLGLLEIAALN